MKCWLLVVAACSQPPALVSNQGASPAEPVGASTIGQATVFVDATGARLANVFGFHRQPETGSRVTVLPLSYGPPFELAITSSKLRDDVPDELWWEVELEAIRDPAVLAAAPVPGRDAAYPFDAVVLHPVRPSARLVRPADVRDLPRGVEPTLIHTAVDLEGDGRVDALSTKYCCNDPGARLDSCDPLCGEHYRRGPSGWRWIRSP